MDGGAPVGLPPAVMGDRWASCYDLDLGVLYRSNEEYSFAYRPDGQRAGTGNARRTSQARVDLPHAVPNSR